MEDRRYFGCWVTQREDSDTPRFFIFQARAKDIREWVGIRRIAEIEGGTQRLLRPARSRAIARFLEADPTNTIPNSILVAFAPSKATFGSLGGRIAECIPEVDPYNQCSGQLDWGILEFSFEPNQPEHLRPALIVDGQHRLEGMSEYDKENVPVLVVSLVDADVQEQAFQFIVINNKAVRVPTDNVKAIIADLDVAQLQERLLEAGVRYGDVSPILRDINDLESSPFRNLLDWPYNREEKEEGERRVNLTAIEQSLKFIRVLFPFFEDDEDSLVGFFCAIWRAAKANYPDLWGKDNKLMTKVNINALNEYIAERLKHAWEFDLIDIFDPDAVEKQVLGILQLLPQAYWTAEWSIRIQDNANVRRIIKEDLNKLAQNYKLRRPWSEGLELPTVSE